MQLHGPLDFFKNLFASRSVRAEAIASTVYFFTGERPLQLDGQDTHGAFTKIIFTPGQVVKLRAMLEGWMESAPGDVRVEVDPVIRPIIIKKAAPWLAGSALAGGLLGFFGMGR